MWKENKKKGEGREGKEAPVNVNTVVILNTVNVIERSIEVISSEQSIITSKNQPTSSDKHTTTATQVSKAQRQIGGKINYFTYCNYAVTKLHV